MDNKSNLDIFICHASEDKSSIVRSLASEFRRLGVNIFYDEYSIELGESILQKINLGLSNTRFGLVVFSENFFKKDWPKDELDGLYSREKSKDCKIIPIWHNCDENLINKYYPPFALRKSLKTQGNSLFEIVMEILRIIRPDIEYKIQNQFNGEKILRYAQNRDIPISSHIGPLQPLHQSLPESICNRLRLLRLSLWDIDKHSYNYWYDSFRGESMPSEELSIWEKIAYVYNEFVNSENLTSQQKQLVYKAIIGLTVGTDYEEVLIEAGITKQQIGKILEIAGSSKPIIDIDDIFPYVDNSVDVVRRDCLNSKGLLEDFSSETIQKSAQKYYHIHYKDKIEATLPFNEDEIVKFIKSHDNIVNLRKIKNKDTEFIYYKAIYGVTEINFILNNKNKLLQIYSGYLCPSFTPDIEHYEELIGFSMNLIPKFLYKYTDDAWSFYFTYSVYSFLDELCKNEILNALKDINILMQKSKEMIKSD